jgi:hypothetical protein
MGPISGDDQFILGKGAHLWISSNHRGWLTFLSLCPIAKREPTSDFNSWYLQIKDWGLENNTNLNSIFCFIKSSAIIFFLPAFYLIMWVLPKYHLDTIKTTFKENNMY